MTVYDSGRYWLRSPPWPPNRLCVIVRTTPFSSSLRSVTCQLASRIVSTGQAAVSSPQPIHGETEAVDAKPRHSAGFRWTDAGMLAIVYQNSAPSNPLRRQNQDRIVRAGDRSRPWSQPGKTGGETNRGNGRA